MSRATGISRTTISQGIKELADPKPAEGRTRCPGGGRKRIVDSSPGLRDDLDALLDPATRGDPESSLRWTCKSLRKLAAELARAGHVVSHQVVGNLLREMGYSLQANRRTHEASRVPTATSNSSSSTCS